MGTTIQTVGSAASLAPNISDSQNQDNRYLLVRKILISLGISFAAVGCGLLIIKAIGIISIGSAFPITLMVSGLALAIITSLILKKRPFSEIQLASVIQEPIEEEDRFVPQAASILECYLQEYKENINEVFLKKAFEKVYFIDAFKKDLFDRKIAFSLLSDHFEEDQITDLFFSKLSENEQVEITGKINLEQERQAPTWGWLTSFWSAPPPEIDVKGLKRQCLRDLIDA